MKQVRIFNKIMSVVLAMVMVVSMLPMSVFAAGNVAKVGDTEYATIDEAIAAWTNGTTLTLLADVTLSDVITLKSTEHHILDLGTYTMTAASGKNAFVIQACGTGAAERSAITINADATDPGGINAGSKCVIYYKYADGGITTEDRPIIKINGGVFTGSTAGWGTAGIYTIGTAARKCATLNISGGTFNCSILGSGKSKLIISGGTFNNSVSSQGDSTCSRLISGGTFKTIGFMTADENNTKFWIGTSMGNSDVGVYVDDNGYIVVGGSVITEAGETFEASASYSGASSYLQYSSAATNSLYYTSVEEAFADNNKTTGSVTVYVDELDMTDISYKGTIVVPEGEEITIIVEEGTTPAWTVSAAEGTEVVYTTADGNELVKGEDGSFVDPTSEPEAAVAVIGAEVVITAVEDAENAWNIELAEGAEFPAAGVTMTFPAVEGASDGDSAFVVHEHDGVNYIYVGTVADGSISFTNTVGFSTFTVNAGGLAEALAAAEDGDIITVTAGTYDLTEQLVIDKAVTIQGAGVDSTILNYTVDDGSVAVSVTGSGVTMKDLTVNHVNTSDYNSTCIALGGSDNTLDTVKFTGGRYALSMRGENLTVQNCTFGTREKEHILIYTVTGTTNIVNNDFGTSSKQYILVTTDSSAAAGTTSGTMNISGNKADSLGQHFFNYEDSSNASGLTLNIEDNRLTNIAGKAVVIHGSTGAFSAITVTGNVMTRKDGTDTSLICVESASTGTTVTANGNYFGSDPDLSKLVANRSSDDNTSITVENYYNSYDADTDTLTDLVSTTPAVTSTLTNCYTSETGYWGECGGNASESFEFKFYNGETYMGCTSLNNVDGIIDGDVYVSWHIKLDAASNTDEYWTMAWAIQPTIAMQPTRVEHWIDGVKAAECVVEPNWSDSIFPVVAAVTDADGKILSYVNNHEGHTLQAALNAGGNITLLRDVTLADALTIPAGKEVTLDLNGYTITYTAASGNADWNKSMITNKGTLTINDSSEAETGEIYYDVSGMTPDTSHGAGNYTIDNAGTLTVNGGKITIANLKSHAKYPINNNSTSGDAVFVMNGGHLYNYNTSAIRQFCNSTTYQNSVTINGGLVEGYCAIWVQNPGKNTVNGALSITDGEIKTTAAAYANGTAEIKDVASAIYCTIDGDGGAWSVSSAVSITGGTINENVDLAEAAPATITIGEGATFNGYVETPTPTVVVVNDTAEAQAALDAAKDGTTIQLVSNVSYGVLYVGRPTKSNDTTMYCETHDFTATDAAAFAEHLADGEWHTTPRYTTNLTNVTIIGAEGATVAGVVATSGHAYGDVYDYVLDKDYDGGSAYYSTLNITDLTFNAVNFTGKIDINTSDATSVYDGVHFVGCTFTTGGTESTNGAAIRYYNEANNGNVKNITVEDCTFTNCYQGVYVHHVSGVTVTGSTFNTTGHNAIALQGHDGAVDFGTVVISGNTFNNISDRVIRLGDVDEGSAISITGNTITNSGDEDGELIKATTIAESATITRTGNTWNGVADETLVWVDGVLSMPTYVAQVGDNKYTSIQAAVDAAEDGDTVKITADVSDEAVTVDKNLTITGTGSVTLNNVSFNANGADELTVSGLTFTGNSWINSGTAEKLTVSGVTANVTPVNATYTNSRSAFISLGSSEQQTLELTVTDCSIVAAGGADPVLGWAAITKATITGNTFGSADAYQENSDSVKFMSIADDAVFDISGNTVYSNYNGFVFAQNTTRDNAYTANISGNTFLGSADHVWLEVTGATTCHATVNAASTNTVNGDAFTAGDIKASSSLTTWTSWGGVDVVTDEEGKVIGGTLTFAAEDAIADGYEMNEDGKVVEATPEVTYVAYIGTTGYATLQAAVEAAGEGDEIVLAADAYIEENTDVTIPDGVTLNGNGYTIYASGADHETTTGYGYIIAGGALTIKGVTKVEKFSASYYDHVITIGEGASLEVFGKNRVTLAYGNAIHVTGTLTDAKNADKSAITPSLNLAAGISITGSNDAALTVENAYVVFGDTSSKNSAANGTFDLSFTNSIVEFTKQFTLSAPTNEKNPTFNVAFKDSVVTTATKMCLAAPNSTVVVDNSTVTLGTNLRNSGALTIMNGSAFTGSMIQFGENGGNDGTITVDNASLAITMTSAAHAMDGNDTGKLVLKNGAAASIDYIVETAVELGAGTELTCASEGLNATTDPAYKVVYAEGKYTAVEASLSGSGTEENPYLIESLANLQWFRDDVNAGNTYAGEYVKLTADIDLNGEEWTPIGNSTNQFQGSFDGGENTISNLYINDGLNYYDGGEHYVGLFGYIRNGGYIKDLNIVNVDITGCLYVGAVVGRVYIGGVIENCHVSGSIDIEGYWYVGGIAGRYEYGSGIYNCSVTGTAENRGTIEADVDADTNKDADGSYVGGIVGFTTEPNPVVTIKGNSVSYVNITGMTRVGGISGIAHSGNQFTDNAVSNVNLYAVQPEGYDDEDKDTIGLIAGACQGTAENPVVFTNCTATDATAYLNGEIIAVGEYGTNIGGTVPVTNYVAEVNGVQYTDLQAAIDAANGGTVTLVRDLTIESDLNNAGKGYFNIADDQNVTIDLNDHTISATDNSTGNFILFYNYGELTIKNGTVNLTALNNRAWSAESAIILNRGGVLNVESGTYTHNGGTDMAFVVDNSGNYYGDATTNIKDGTLTSSYVAIRNRMEQNSHGASGTAYLNISGGTITGDSRAVWAQAASTSTTSPATGAINVTGGEVGLIDTARSAGAESMTTISGGTVAAFKGEVGELTVTGGTITGVTILTADGATAEYAITASGLYAQAVAKVGENNYATLADALAAVQTDDTVTLLTDVTLTASIEVTEDVVIDLDEKTITGPSNDIENGTIFSVSNGASLTVQNGKLISYGFGICSNGDGSNANKIILNKVTLEAYGTYGIYHNGSYYGADVTITDSTIYGYYYGVYLSGSNDWGDGKKNSLDITNSSVEGGATAVEVKRGDVTVTNSSLTSDYPYWFSQGHTNFVPTVYNNDSGPCTYGYALALTNSGTATTAEASTGTVTINSGTFTGPIGIKDDDSTDMIANTENAKITIYGGTYSNDVSDYCADGFTCEANEDGTYGIVKAALFEITMTNVRMGQNLSLLFAFEQSNITDASLDGYVAKVSIAHEDGTVESEISADEWTALELNDKYYVVEFSGLAAKEMDDEVTVTIYKGDTAVSKPKTTSLRLYGEERLANSSNAEYKTTVVDMLNYGAAAQTQMGYKTTQLANRNIEAYQELATAEESMNLGKVNQVTVGNADYFAGVNMRFRSDITMLFAVAADCAAESARITFTNHRTLPVETVAESYSVTTISAKQARVFEFTGMVVADIDQEITAEFFDADGNVVLTLTSSINAYLTSMQTQGSSAMKDLAIAFGKFSTSAYAYQH